MKQYFLLSKVNLSNSLLSDIPELLEEGEIELFSCTKPSEIMNKVFGNDTVNDYWMLTKEMYDKLIEL